MELGTTPFGYVRDLITTANIGRVTQLVNKTSQFNLTTRRYTDSQIARLAADQAGWARAFHLADRFDDYGLSCQSVVNRSCSSFGS